MRESVSKQKDNYLYLAKMLTCLDAVVENAVGVEVHNRNDEGYKKDDTLGNVYVLVSAFEDGESIVPVKLEIKEFLDKENTLHVAIALESINKDGIVKQEDAKEGVARQDSPPSIISIAELFQKINPIDKSFLKYLPDGFLNEEQRAAKQQALAEDAKKAEKLQDKKPPVTSGDETDLKANSHPIKAKHSLDDTQKSRLMAAANGDKSALDAITESDTELLRQMKEYNDLQERKRAADEDFRVNEDENAPAKENATEAKNKAPTEIEESTDDVDLSEDLTEDVEDTAETVTEETTEEATVDEAIEEETAEEYRDNYTAAEKEFARKLMRRPKNFDLLPYETRKNILDMVRSAKGVDKDSIQYAATLMERRFGLRIEFGNYKNKGLHFQSGNGRRLMLVRSSDANHALIHELWHELYKTDAGQKIVSDLKGSEIVKGYEDDYATRYKQHTGKEISDELKTEEGIGDLLAEKLNDIRFVKRFARSQRGFFLRSIGFLSDLMADIKNVKNPVYRDARRLERMFIEGIGRYTYEDAYASEALRMLSEFEEIENKHDLPVDGQIVDARTLTEQDVRTLLENVQNGEYESGTYIPLRTSTPQFLIDVVHEHSKGKTKVENLPLASEVEHLAQDMEEDDGQPSGEHRPHGLEPDDIIQVLKKMGAPAYIVLQKNGRYAAIVSFYDKRNKQVLVSVDFASRVEGNQKNFKHEQYMNGYKGEYYNVIVTMFEPDNLSKYLEDNEIVYDKKKMNGKYQVGSGRIVAVTHDTPFIDNSIPDSSEKSNTFSKNSLENSSAKHSLDVRLSDRTAKAADEFGYTPYFSDAGYLLANGRMLNFSGEKNKHFGMKGLDHRAIGRVYDGESSNKAMLQFMDEGNVRIMATSPGIDLGVSVEPTTSQYNTIARFIYESKKKGRFYVDFTDVNGKPIGSLEYDGTIDTEEILYDIKEYYRRGVVRDQSNDYLYSGTRYSLDSALESSLESTGVGAEKGYREGVRGKAKTMMIGARIAFFDAYAGVIDYLVKQGGYTQQEAEVAVQKARMGASRGNGAIESGQLVDGKVESCLRSRKNKQLDREKNLWYNIF